MPQVSQLNVAPAQPLAAASASKPAKQTPLDGLFAALVEVAGPEGLVPVVDTPDTAPTAPARLDGLLQTLLPEGLANVEPEEASAPEGDDTPDTAGAVAAVASTMPPGAAAVTPVTEAIPVSDETMPPPAPLPLGESGTATAAVDAATTAKPPIELLAAAPSGDAPVNPVPETTTGPLADSILADPAVQPVTAGAEPIQPVTADIKIAADVVPDRAGTASSNAARLSETGSATGRSIGQTDPGAAPAAPQAVVKAAAEPLMHADAATSASPVAQAETTTPAGAAKPAETADTPAPAARKESTPSPAATFSATLENASTATAAADSKPQAPTIPAAGPQIAAAPVTDAQPPGTGPGPVTQQQAVAAVPIAGIPVEIAARARTDGNRFEIRLDPPELGRIDVRLDIDGRGQVTSRLVVEKAETLDLLRRDVHQLERALQDAGLKISDGSLHFSLRDHAFAGRNGERDGQPDTRLVVPEPDAPPADLPSPTYGRFGRLGGGVDIRV